MDSSFGNEKIKFPVDCHYKIIAENIPGVDELIKQALHNHGVHNPLTRGSLSEKGHYITFNVEVRIHSLESMKLLDRALKSISGVKMVL